MNTTTEILDKLNTAIKEQFTLLNIPRQSFGDVHDSIQKIVTKIEGIPDGLSYFTWFIRAESKLPALSYEMDIFTLDTEGCFEVYKNSKSYHRTGKWIAVPQYKFAKDTTPHESLEMVIMLKELQLMKKRLEASRVHIAEVEESLKNSRQYMAEEQSAVDDLESRISDWTLTPEEFHNLTK